ncbi:MAG: hypothetical protein OSB58_21145 [Alphaproteobacteria bacterium]|nr:hypothetical protein [Alphaproteobacteria bacterium]
MDDLTDPYPEGSRDKSAMECPDPASFEFLKPGHRYLFKHSNKNYPEQFWAEIIAYKVGCQMSVPVPPAFAAFNSSNESHPAALIEWFYDWDADDVLYVPGGNFMTRMIDNFDSKRGTQHNLGTIIDLIQVFESDRLNNESSIHWGKAFVFDALIGNTDRHQDNWGWLRLGQEKHVDWSPAFDNGTSLGHEILERNFPKFQESSRLDRYISNGHHHVKWLMEDEKPMQHVELVRRYVAEFPETRDHIMKCLAVDMDQLEIQLRELCEFECKVSFSEARCDFVILLLKTRLAALSAALGA